MGHDGHSPRRREVQRNGSNAAKNTTATFSKAGNYTFQVTITDPGGLTATSSVSVTVNQTLTSVAVKPGFGQLERGGDAAVRGHGQGPVRRRRWQPARVHLDDAGGTISSQRPARRPPTRPRGTVTATSGLVSGTAA